MSLLNVNLRLGSLISSCRTLLNTNWAISCTIPIQTCSYASTRSLEERLGMPPKPKKPLTPYFRFMKEIRPVIAEQNPKANLTEIVKIVAKKWETVDEATKSKLQDAFKKEQITYVEQRAKYDSKITEDQRKDLHRLRQEISQAKERRATRKRIKELGRPKKPVSAFLRFIVRERAKVTSNDKESYKDWHRKVCEKWARLADAEKEKIKEECRKEMEVYKQEMSKWEEKMVRMGNIDVVRQEAMIEPAGSTKTTRATRSKSTSAKSE